MNFDDLINYNWIIPLKIIPYFLNYFLQNFSNQRQYFHSVHPCILHPCFLFAN